MKLTFRNNLILLCGVLISTTVLVYLYNFESPWFINPRVWYNDDLFTRGLIHYQSMDNGIKSSCWHRTGKHYLQLVCPFLEPNSDIEVELAFYITSCFCESIGRVPIYCKIKNKRTYGRALANCAKGKCHNNYGHDSFHIILTRMYALCHYYLQESSVNSKLKAGISEFELEDLIYEAQGAGSGRPELKYLLKLVQNEIIKRKTQYNLSFTSYLDGIWQDLENLGYHLGLVYYEYDH